MTEKINVSIDDRESKEIIDTAYMLNQDNQYSHINIKIERLQEGDMITTSKTNCGTVCIEFKRGDDFIISIIDGRIHEQIIKMKDNFNLCVFILVNTDTALDSHPNMIAAYYAMLGAIGSKYQCSVYQVNNDMAAVMLALSIIKHSNIKPKLKSQLHIKSLINGQDRHIASISCIKTIGKELSERLLIKWSIKEISNITNWKTLSKEIEGIGEKKAKEIISFYNDPDYSNKFSKIYWEKSGKINTSRYHTLS